MFNETNRPDSKYFAGFFDSLRVLEGCFAISGMDLKPDICAILKFWYHSRGIFTHKHFFLFFFSKRINCLRQCEKKTEITQLGSAADGPSQPIWATCFTSVGRPICISGSLG